MKMLSRKLGPAVQRERYACAQLKPAQHVGKDFDTPYLTRTSISMRPGRIRPGNVVPSSAATESSSCFNEARADSPGKSQDPGPPSARAAGFNEARADSPGKFAKLHTRQAEGTWLQ